MKPKDSPVVAVIQRVLPIDYSGPVYLFDIDKTYLATNFSSLGGLLTIPLEWGMDKVEVAGMPTLLRGLRRGLGEVYASNPIYFLTASPPQLLKSLCHKMLIDGVESDGIIFKNWRKTFLSGHWGRFVRQAGMKLCALLDQRIGRPLAKEYLFGDDYEQDPEIFTTYAAFIDRSLNYGAELRSVLSRLDLDRKERQFVEKLVVSLPPSCTPVEGIFIRKTGKRGAGADPTVEPERLTWFGDATALAEVLYERGLVDSHCVEELQRRK